MGQNDSRKTLQALFEEEKYGSDLNFSFPCTFSQ